MNIPNRASDAGPESLSYCQKCNASLRNSSTHACEVCEGPCCDACATETERGWVCRDHKSEDDGRCHGTEVNVHPFDFGVCSQTGYHDAGERITCTTCGRDVDERELREAPEETGWICNARPEPEPEPVEAAEFTTDDTTPF